MKKNIHIAALILLAISFFNASAARAKELDRNFGYYTLEQNSQGYNSHGNNNNQGGNNHNYGGKTTNGGPATSSSANLPINNGVVFLFFAGMAIGIVTLKKSMLLKPALA